MSDFFISILMIFVGVVTTYAFFTKDGRKYAAASFFGWKKNITPRDEKIASWLHLIMGSLILLFGLLDLVRALKG